MLGGKLPGDKTIVWKKPGATRKARFMAFGLLVLKIFAFSEQEVVKENCLSDVEVVELEEEGRKKKAKNSNKPKKKKTKKILVFNPEQEERVERICVFALSFYIPTFFNSSWGCDAPGNDLQLYKDLLALKKIDETLAEAALATLDRHCWYLAPSVVMFFSLFRKKVLDDIKAMMAGRLLSFEKPEARMNLPEYPTMTEGSELWDFVQPHSWDFFTILRVKADWLTWPLDNREKSKHHRSQRRSEMGSDTTGGILHSDAGSFGYHSSLGAVPRDRRTWRQPIEPEEAPYVPTVYKESKSKQEVDRRLSQDDHYTSNIERWRGQDLERENERERLRLGSGAVTSVYKDYHYSSRA